MDVNALVARRIRRRRRLMDVTQQELAAACGFSLQQMQLYESAHIRVSVEVLWKLACALDVEVGYFFIGLTQDAAPAAPALHLSAVRISA